VLEIIGHGSLNVPIEHHPTIRYMVNAMATMVGDVQYSQNGTFGFPSAPPRRGLREALPTRRQSAALQGEICQSEAGSHWASLG